MSDEPEDIEYARKRLASGINEKLYRPRELIAAYEAGLAAAPRAKCRVCNGKGYHAGDPEGAAIEGCSDCLETGFQVNEDEGSKIDLAFVCAGLSAADKRSVVERILALGSRIDQLEAAAPRAGVGWKLFETARDVVMASTQDATGRFYIEGDAEVMLGDLYAAVEEVRTAAPPAVSDPHAELVAAREPIVSDIPAWRRIIDLFAKHGLPAPPVALRDELVIHLAVHDQFGGYRP